MDIYFRFAKMSKIDFYIDNTIKCATELIDEGHYKNDAIQILAWTYRRFNKPEDAIDMVKNLSTLWISKEILLPEVSVGENRIKSVQEIFLELITIFDTFLLQTYGREEVGNRDKVLLKEVAIINIIFENKDYGWFNVCLYNIYLICARDKAYIKDVDKTIEYLYKAYDYAKAFDELRKNKQEIKHTSFLVDRLTDNSTNWGYEEDDKFLDRLKEEMHDERFAYLQEVPEFKKLEDKIIN